MCISQYLMQEKFSIIITINPHKNITFLIKNIYKNKYILIDKIKLIIIIIK